MRLVFVLTLGLGVVTGCGGDAKPMSARDGGADGAADGAVDGGPGDDGAAPGMDGGLSADEWPELGEITYPSAFATVGTPEVTDGVACTDVTYESDGLTIHGRACRPDGATDLPLLIYNDELERYADSRGDVRAWAKLGFAVFQSSYRGVAGSGGHIELCRGEVRDVRRLLHLAKAADYVDADRVFMVGFSHGGCISMKTLAAEHRWHTTEFVAVSNAYGLEDTVAALESQRAFLKSLPPLVCTLNPAACSELSHALDVAEMSVMDDPNGRTTYPLAGLIDDSGTPLLIQHATGDVAVPYDQNCHMADAIGGFQAFHVDLGGNTVTTVPDDCASFDLPWSSAAAPPATTYPDRTLVISDTVRPLGHSRDQGAGVNINNRARAFIMAHM